MSEGIGKRIAILRKVEGINQTEMAKMLKKSQSKISAMEKGEKQITVEDVEFYCRYFEKSADWLIFGDNDGQKALKKMIENEKNRPNS